MHTTTLDFNDPLWLKLNAYLEATDGKMCKFVRRAINERIDTELAENPGIKNRFETQQAQLLVKAGGNISLIGQRRKPKKKLELAASAVVAAE